MFKKEKKKKKLLKGYIIPARLKTVANHFNFSFSYKSGVEIFIHKMETLSRDYTRGGGGVK